MGIRIHKILGFGLDDVKTNEATNQINDERLNYKDNPWFNTLDVRSFYQWWIDNEKDKHNKFYAELYLKDLEQGHIDASVKRFSFYEDEGGLPNVLAFIAPSVANEWFRYDDAIDYYEARPNLESTVQIINRTIFPWDTYWDTTTIPPKKLNGTQFQTFVSYTQSLEDENFKIANIFAERLIEERINIDKVRPSIPPEIVALVKYMKIFKEDKHIYEMKPMIYTYWS
jgi:hypothetical protein